MRRYLKYEYDSKEAFNVLKDTHLTDEDGNLLKGIHVVEIGDIVVTPAVMDGEEITTPAVMTGRHAVDILWEIPMDENGEAELIKALEANEIYPNPCGVHTFSGLTGLYELEFYNKFPELKPVIEEV